MNKKVRVLKEMPFANVGDIVDLEYYKDKSTFESSILCVSKMNIGNELEDLIKRGWIEWVEEDKILEEKFRYSLNDSRETYLNPYAVYAQIAKEHYQKKFDDFMKLKPEEAYKEFKSSQLFKNLHKAMFWEEV